MKRVFLAAPFTFNFEAEFLDHIEEFLMGLGYSVIVPHDFANDDVSDEEIRRQIHTDLAQVENSDILIADVTKPSHGVGMEILHAHKLGKRVILIAQSGTRISSMARVHSHNTLEYNNSEELKQKLESCLQSV